MDVVNWLEAHEGLSGWAQFVGAVFALLATYLTAFAPSWRRRRQLRAEALRLLMHGYETIESFHRTSAEFLPFQLSLRQAALSMIAVIEDLSRFPVYELDNNFGPYSLARRLMVMRMTISASLLFINTLADELEDRAATQDELDDLRLMIGERLKFAYNLLMGIPMERPASPNASAKSSS